MKNRFALAVLLMISPVFSKAQQAYPQKYFIPPLDTPLIITGSFGELRDDHFHSGIDISTNDQEGVPVVVAADGYISRIKISSEGYGKALYVTHPNGYVTVYGHLQKFTGPVDEYIRKMQYERQVFELDVTPNPKDFRVKQRDVIAYSGSSGSAEAPHLHFEIRDQKTEEPINPLLFGLPVNDNYPPELKFITIYPMRENGILNNTDSAMTYEIHPDSATLLLNTLEDPVAFGNIAFGFGAVDHQDSGASDLGIYSADLYVDGILTYFFKYDRLNFSDTRDINAHIDYEKKTRDNVNIERCFKLPGDRTKLSGDTVMSGVSNFNQDDVHLIRIVVSDFSGKKSEIEFQLTVDSALSEKPYQAKPDNAVLVTNEKGVSVHKAKYEVSIPEGAVYEDYYYNDEMRPGGIYLSDIFRIGNSYEALRDPITISIKPTGVVADSLKPKMLIGRFANNAEMKSCGGQWNGKFFTAKSNYFGSFVVTIDTTPPTVEKYYTPADMNEMYGGEVRLIIKDELSGIKNYSCKIDDKWYLFEYDKKTNMIIANVDPLAENKDHELEITVTDERGNTRIWKSSFYF